MNRILIILCCISLFSCNSEKGWNCIKTAGTIVSQERGIIPFSEIVVEDDLFLDIEQGEIFSVTVTSGENIIDDITVEVEDGILKLNNTNRCNFNRDHDISRVHVVTPTLTNIRSSSINEVRSVGTLGFESITMISDTRVGVVDAGKSGDFILDVANERVAISANGQSEFIMTGATELFSIGLLDEIPKVTAGSLIANKVTVFTRSANSITVFPVNEITGTILGAGDVFSKNRPLIVDVEALFTGQLIFE